MVECGARPRGADVVLQAAAPSQPSPAMRGHMTKAARALVLLTFLGVCATGASSEVRFKSYYSGIPDYESTTVFQAEPARSHLELRAAVRNAVNATVLCVRGQVKATVVAPHVFTTNICGATTVALTCPRTQRTV